MRAGRDVLVKKAFPNSANSASREPPRTFVF
jgi:hypothetical protein